MRVQRRVRALVGLQPSLSRFAHDIPDDAEHRREELVPRRQADELVEARVFVGVGLTRGDLPLLSREDLPELGELWLSDALGGEGRDRRLDQAAELYDVRERVPAGHETGQRTGEVVGGGLTDEGAAACPGLDDAEKLEGSQRFPNRGARDLELLRELSLGRKLVAGAKVAFLQQTLDLLDDALVEAAATDRLDDGQGVPPEKPLVRWSDQAEKAD
jgi:hypothetical protein